MAHPCQPRATSAARLDQDVRDKSACQKPSRTGAVSLEQSFLHLDLPAQRDDGVFAISPIGHTSDKMPNAFPEPTGQRCQDPLSGAWSMLASIPRWQAAEHLK